MGLTKPIWRKPRMQVAELVAASVAKGRRVALRILRDERKWIQSRAIRRQVVRERASIISRLDDEGTQLAIREFIAGTGDGVTSHRLAQAITTYWATGNLPLEETECVSAPLPLVGSINPPLVVPEMRQDAVEKVLTSRTAARWLNQIGYKYKECKKGVYKDGHERADVVTYRQDVFLPALEDLEPYLVHWRLDDNGKPIMVLPEGLPPGQKPIVLVTHDESTFDSNEGRGYGWMKDGEPPIRKKSRGKGIMVSHFVTQGGHLAAPSSLPVDLMPTFGLDPEENLRYSPYTATMRIEYGGENWWDGEDLIQQVVKVAIPIFEAAFPGCQALFLFDNATSHSAFAADALRAKKMSLRPGGAQSKLRAGTNPLTGTSQSMVDPNGNPKGLKWVLEERGLWRRGLRLQCRKPGTDKLLKTCLLGGQCCARALIADQADFRNQKCQLQEEVEKLSHQVLFYPKFHCELNFIEYVWGAAKRYTRNHCGYNIKSLRRLIALALDSVSDQLVWKFAQRTNRIMDTYRQGIVYGTPEFQASVKHKYKSHRRVTDTIELD